MAEKKKTKKSGVSEAQVSVTESSNGGKSCHSSADEAYSGRQYKKALELYTRVIEQSGPGAVILNNRGLSYYALGDLDLAIKDFTQAIELDPLLIHAFNNRGLAYQRQGLYELANADFCRADQIDPQYSLEGTHVMPKLDGEKK